jgi:hypothetical protein
MPLPKSLRRPVIRAASSTGLAQRKRCRTCNNLDPRGHGSSVYASEAAKEPTARLDLVLDALALARTKSTDCGGCRFCNVLVQTLDAFFQKWRGARCRVNVSLKEKGTIKVSIDDERWKGEIVEIYAGSGRFPFLSCFLEASQASFLPCRWFRYVSRTVLYALWTKSWEEKRLLEQHTGSDNYQHRALRGQHSVLRIPSQIMLAQTRPSLSFAAAFKAVLRIQTTPLAGSHPRLQYLPPSASWM